MIQGHLDRIRVTTGMVYARYANSQLLKSGAWYLVSMSTERGLNFFAVLLFTRLLSVEEYGTVAIFLPWVTIFASTLTLNVYTAVGRGRHDFDNQQFKGFVSASIALGTMASLIGIVAIYLIPNELISEISGLSKTLILLAGVIACVDISVHATLGIWQMEYKYRQHSFLSLGLAVAKILVPTLLIVLPIAEFQQNKALARILGLTGVSIVAGTYLLIKILYEGRTFIHTQYWRYALTYSVPLIPHVLARLILAQIDRLLIDQYIGRDAAGLYTLGYQIGEIVSLLWTATNYAWVPWFYMQVKQEKYILIRKRSSQYLLGFTLVVAGLILIGPWLLTVLSPPDYWSTRSLVPLVMGAQFFSLCYAFYVNLEFYEKKTVYISIGTALAAAINIALNLLLLPRFGYVASAWATLAAYVLLFLFHAAIVTFILRKSSMFNFRLMVVVGVGIIALSTTAYIANL